MTTVDVGIRAHRAFGRSTLVRSLALAALVALLAFLTAYPMAMLVYGSLHTTPPGEAGAFSLDGYRAMLSRANALVLLNTIGLSLVRTDTAYRESLEVMIPQRGNALRPGVGARRHPHPERGRRPHLGGSWLTRSHSKPRRT